MASGGGDLSTRMAAEDQNVDNRLFYDTALNLFKRLKVEISEAIKTTFPFLEYLRDNKLISDELYQESKQFYNGRCTLQEVVYIILCDLEKKPDLSYLQTIFNNVIRNNYPGLNRFYRMFKNVIPDKNFFLESDYEEMEEWPNIPLYLEQGTGENANRILPLPAPHSSINNGTALPENRRSEHLGETGQTNAMETGTSSDNGARESLQENEQCDQLFESPVITEDSCGEDEQPSTSAGKRQSGTVDPANNATSRKVTRKRKAREQTDESVNYENEILPVVCGEMKGMLIKRKLERGARTTCIRSDDGNQFTPREFEIKGGRGKSSNWKQSIRCGGKTLGCLIKDKTLLEPPGQKGREKKENSHKCKICLDGGILYFCNACHEFFHGDCHIPAVETNRSCWTCTFCMIKNSLRSQERHKESEVLARPMQPAEQLKCVFLLLTVYCRLESDVHENIPHENYNEMASKCLEKLRRLDEIKKKLTGGEYTKVGAFVLAMNPILQNASASQRYDANLIEKEFNRNFREVFAVEETSQNSSLQ
ncbi:nuclear body protein SP140-like protein isoform X1 [Saccopteryx bilineata]|uniref:nuclear body protein SP140-like protein isoform X1 n=1 Tax=Saccopteryx bilineata TaxID=59482 RepID=UPI0033900414